MHIISVPISMSQVNDKTLPIYLEHLRRCRATRVFLGGLGNIYMKTGLNHTDPDHIRRTITYFRNAGIEVAIWVPSFGNGHALTPIQAVTDSTASYTQITGIHGEARENLSACPLDENFVKDYCAGIQSVAALGPDMIMLDDDFRFNIRIKVHFACFCDLHLKEYYTRIGEVIPREKLEKILLTGGKNKYRTELLKLFHDTLIGFAHKVRAAVDTVDPTIRVGACTHQTWDLHGTDPLEIAKAFAGKTKPFTRIAGAPFRNPDIIPILENSRQQCAWGKNSDVEMFSEGDTFPRPRIRIPSKPMELFDLMLCADGCTDGILAYVECYDNKPDYEEGYVNRFAKNNSLRDSVFALFRNKTPVGVEVATIPHKAEDWELPQNLHPMTAEMLTFAADSPARDLLSANSIPTCYCADGTYPLLIIGENARHIALERLNAGAILDAAAAQILESRGVDVGLDSLTALTAGDERYCSSGEVINRINCARLHIRCKEGSQVLSHFVPGEYPASYRYENKDGQRFYVLAFDLYRSWCNNIAGRPDFEPHLKNYRPNFEVNYYRQTDLVNSIEWICGKKLPAVTFKNPNLYVLASKNNNAMAVALANVHLDDVYEPVITLDKPYTSIQFINCTGRLKDNKVYIDHIPPYGFAAFEVTP